MRHGEAEDYADGGDAMRPLTDRGHTAATRAGRLLQRLGLRPGGVVCSPLVRARQTAHDVWVAATGAALEGAVNGLAEPTDTRLVPGASPRQTIAALLEHAGGIGDGPLLAVGHNPSVTVTLGQLVCGDPGMHFAVSTADLAHLHVSGSPARAVLLGYYPAAALDRLER